MNDEKERMREWMDGIKMDEKERLTKWRKMPVMEKPIAIDYNSYGETTSLLYLAQGGVFRACDTPSNGWCSYIIHRDGKVTETITIGEFLKVDKFKDTAQTGGERVFLPCDKCRKIIIKDFEMEMNSNE